MLGDPLFYAAAAALSVVAILIFGLYTFARGGEFHKKHANRIMRYRIGMQFVAVFFVVLFVYLRVQSGQ